MQDGSLCLGLDDTLLMLNFATRLLATELDRDKLVARALDTFSDFGKSKRIALLTMAADPGDLCVEGVLIEGLRSYPDYCIPLEQPFRDMAEAKTPSAFPSCVGSPYPLPNLEEDPDQGPQCLCVPMIGANNKFVGMVTLEHPPGFSLPKEELLQLIVLAAFTALAYENIRLFRQAIEDDLTGLYLRRYFEIRLQEEMARLRRSDGELSLIFLDIDHFKKVNDTYGHAAGDVVLRTVAGLIQQGVRRGVDIVSRYGGEEFVVLLPGTDPEGARVVAERIRSLVQDHRFDHQGVLHRVTISSGVAEAVEEDREHPQELVRRADMMLLKAKTSGRNRVAVYGEEA